MHSSTVLMALAAAAPAVMAQRPSNVSMCNYYAEALFNTSNATTQYTLLTALVNTAVIGNYTQPNKNAVTGILNNGTYDGRNVSLLKYFDGMLASTNRGGDAGVSVNFLDGGGAEPLQKNMPANGTSSNQYFLLTHLYSYFGALLNCSSYGGEGFPAYGGSGSQYAVHKFMDLSHDEVSYFIQEVGLAATSFGVTTEDATAVGKTLGQVFNYKCAANATVIPSQGSQAQSICVADSCPLAEGGNCDVAPYNKAVAEPSSANSSNMFTSTSSSATGTSAGTQTGTASATTSGSTAGSTGAAAHVNAMGAVVMGAAGIAALAVGL